MSSQLTMKLVISILVLVSCTFAIEFSLRARNFSLEILYHTQRESGGHVVISPLGIWSLMTTVAVGAEGKSQSQLVEALRLPSSQISIVNGYQSLIKTVLDTEDESVYLTSHNFMFIDEAFEINPQFKKKIGSDFKTDIINLQFGSTTEAAKKANDIIKNTGATTSDVFSPGDFSQARFMLTNVINFKGLWKIPFNESNTRVEPFYDENKNKIGEANMMFKEDAVRYSNVQTLQSFVLELPYGNDDKFCMLLVLPYQNIKVTEAYKNLQKVSFHEIFDKLEQDEEEFGPETVEIKLPRFKISSNVVLNKPLMDMGVYDIFDEGSANFKPITDNDIFVAAVVHNANIEVTETGTTASAVTTAEFQDRISTPKFEGNRPFIYFVMEKPTATIIFGGIYSKPSVF
ncbi:serine protease inhibitor 77Ba-like [Aricia agestis]|uniref:serine protease inhibitor 77Ba-like n=1 Tax=Aricia agestis TaxID=91739 RepID=UPI001C205681|nr:serine protease inhibitor 77Ba-like [Aricia agestis]